VTTGPELNDEGNNFRPYEPPRIEVLHVSDGARFTVVGSHPSCNPDTGEGC
jgi:hypothetical protein